MKKLLVLFIAVFCMCCMVACGSETNDTTDVGGNHEIVSDSENKPVVTEAPVDEPEATPEPTVEPTPEPTPDPYADLSGKEWVKTFKDVVDEPTVVIFNDETGRKEIVEPNDLILVTDANDVLALHLPQGYAMTGQGGFEAKDEVTGEGYKIFYLDFEKMSEKNFGSLCL